MDSSPDDRFGGRWTSPVLVQPPSGGFPRQRGLTCGEVNARSVIDALSASPRGPIRPRWTVRLFGYSLIRDIRDLLRTHGLEPRVNGAGGLSDEEKLEVLTRAIDAGSPVIVAIGNGHLRRGVDRTWARRLFGHYLTVFGYDAGGETFFVYDSYLAGEPDEPLPIGNDTRTREEMLRDWKGPIYYRAIGRDHVFIEFVRGGR